MQVPVMVDTPVCMSITSYPTSPFKSLISPPSIPWSPPVVPCIILIFFFPNRSTPSSSKSFLPSSRPHPQHLSFIHSIAFAFVPSSCCRLRPRSTCDTSKLLADDGGQEQSSERLSAAPDAHTGSRPMMPSSRHLFALSFAPRCSSSCGPNVLYSYSPSTLGFWLLYRSKLMTCV